MGNFDKLEFARSNDPERARRCRDLETYLSDRLKKSSNFHATISEIIEELRERGHDLWSYDEEDEIEVWGPDYVQSKGPGLILTFTAPNTVIVEWNSQERKTPDI
jgi:hypothetical protein